MKRTVLEGARVELNEAITYLENQRQGLGDELNIAVENAIASVLNHPESFALHSGNTRIKRVDKSAYAVLYEATKDGLVIVAIMHLHRRPMITGKTACKSLRSN